MVEQGERLIPVEVKAGQTVTAGYFAGLEHWRKVAGPVSGEPWLVYAGEQPQFRRGANVVPWRDLGRPGGLVEAVVSPAG